MPRELTSHQVNGCNNELRIFVMDEPGHGGACHKYQIVNMDGHKDRKLERDAVECEVNFQNGPIAEVGTNGLTHEALIAILIDRLEGFQSGPYACPENGMVLSCLQSAQRELKSRTEKRLARGVEGTHTV